MHTHNDSRSERFASCKDLSDHVGSRGRNLPPDVVQRCGDLGDVNDKVNQELGAALSIGTVLPAAQRHSSRVSVATRSRFSLLVSQGSAARRDSWNLVAHFPIDQRGASQISTCLSDTVMTCALSADVAAVNKISARP